MRSQKTVRKKFAEVFTPPHVVFLMILQPGIRECLQGVDKTILDPATGEGQFPCCELVWKMFFNLGTLNEETVLRALRSLHAIDIQAPSVAKAKEHLLATIADAYKFFTGKEFTALDAAKEILDENFIVGDSLKIMKQWSDKQQSLF